MRHAKLCNGDCAETKPTATKSALLIVSMSLDRRQMSGLLSREQRQDKHKHRLELARRLHSLNSQPSSSRSSAERQRVLSELNRRQGEMAALSMAKLQACYMPPRRAMPREKAAGRGGSGGRVGGGRGGGGGGGGGGLEVSNVLLGEGASSRVMLGRMGPSDEWGVAVKVCSKATMDDHELQWVREEIGIHKQLHHPHIVRLHQAFETSSSLTIVLSLCRGGSLCDEMGRVLESGTPMGEERARRLFVQMAGALHYCHRSGVVHRDVKLDNLCFVDEDMQTLQLIDFGYAQSRNELDNYAGSPHYAAPEVHAAKASGSPTFSGTAADVWSMGVCLFALLGTTLPFSGEEDSDELAAKVGAGAWDLTPDCGERALELLRGMLAVDAAERYTLDTICDHPWLEGVPVPWKGDDE